MAPMEMYVMLRLVNVVYVNLDLVDSSAQVNRNSFVNINDKKVHTYSKKLDKKIAILVQ